MVRHIEELPAELQVESAVLTEMVILEDAEIEVVLAVTTHAAHCASSGPISVGRRLEEHTRIEPLIEPRARSAGQLAALAVIAREGIRIEGAVYVSHGRVIAD